MRKKLLILLYILFFSCSLCWAQHYKITTYTEEDGLMETEVFHALQDSIGFIWLASRDGLLRYDGSRFQTFKAYAGDNCPLKTNSISFMENHGEKLLCRSQDETFLFDPTTGEFQQSEARITDKNFRKYDYLALYETVSKMKEFMGIGKLKIRLVDSQGGIWVRSTRGLERIEFSEPKESPRKLSLAAEEEVRAVLSARDGRLWVADKNGFIRIFSERKSSPTFLSANGTVSAKTARFGHRAYCMFEDSKGRIWIGCKPTGLFLLTPKKDGVYDVKHFQNNGSAFSISNNCIYSVKEDSKGAIWVATYGGGVNKVAEKADGSFLFLNMSNEMRGYPKDCAHIHGMDITEGGILLLATSNGLLSAATTAEVRKMRFFRNARRLSDNTSLPTDYLYDVKAVKDGKVFVATNGGGISVTESKNLLTEEISFKTIDSRGETLSDVFLTLTVDKGRNVWAMGKNALSMISASGEIRNFTRKNFEGAFRFSEAKPVVTPLGEIISGTTQGYLTFHPDSIRKKTYCPRIAFYCPDTLFLSPEEKSVLVNYAALDYNRNEPITYAYKLEGIDTEWHYTHDCHIYYGNLPGGTFTLRLRSTNSDGVWVENESAITIIRRPAFNETRFAWMLYGILLIGILSAIVLTVKYIHKLKKEMSKAQLEASEKLQYMANRIKELMTGHSNIISSTTSEESTNGEKFREKAKNFVRENISNSDITVDDFAKHMNMSVSQLYLKCKENLGFTPNSYIQNVRINMAVSILDHSKETQNISDLAYRCGFSDPKYFSRCFKKQKGITPTEYIKSLESSPAEKEVEEE